MYTWCTNVSMTYKSAVEFSKITQLKSYNRGKVSF